MDEFLGRVARGVEKLCRIATLPLPQHHADSRHAAPAHRHVGEERQASPGRRI